MAPPVHGRAALPRFLLLYAMLYAAYGVESPFLPALLATHGLGPQAIGAVLAAARGAQLLAGPAAGRVADRLAASRAVLAGCAGAAALAALGYMPARGLWPLLAVGVPHAVLLAPLSPLADALALGAAVGPGRGFEYGWVRGAGAGAFILGSALAGQAVGRAGIGAIVALHVSLLAATAASVLGVPRLAPQGPASASVLENRAGFGTLLRMKLFRRLLLVAALVQGSHALHDGFAVLRWRAAGIGPGAAGLLWSEAVAAEVLVFLLLGRPLLDRLGPAGASALAAGAGALRWAVSAQTAWLPAVALIQPLHGLTFALQHLACMRLMAQIVPPGLAATALTCYGTLGVGAVTTLLTLASGPLYASLGAHGFWVMSALCAAALPLSRGLRR